MSQVETALFQRVASVEQVREGFVTLFKVAGRAVVLTKVQGQIAAFDGVCTHADFKLGTSRLVRGCAIECPVHGALFDAQSGAVTKGPADTPLTKINTRVEGADVLVEVTWNASGAIPG